MGPQIQLYKRWISVTILRLLRRLRAALIVLFGLLVLSFVLYVGYTTWRLRQVEQGWASSFESMEAFAARFPKTSTSSGAWQLHELTQPLGIDIVKKTAKNDRLDAIGAFVTAQQLVADDTTRTAPADVTQFLGEHARRIDAIEDHLLGGSELSWERDLEAGFAEPHPDLIGHRYLQHILLARALEEARQGHSAEVDRSLDASWNLNRSLVGRHELISQLVALSIAATENGILRALPVPPVQWADRVQAQDFPAAFLRALQAEAFLYTNSESVKDFRGVPAFNRLKMADYSEQVRMTTELLRDRDDQCSLDLQAVSRAAEDALPRSNGARTSITSFPRSWGAVTLIRLDGELTRLVMEARRDSGEITQAHSSPVASTVCKSVSWIRTSSADGRVTIAAEPARPLRDESKREWTFSFRPHQIPSTER